MEQNPFEVVLKNYLSLSQCVQAYVSRVFPGKKEDIRGHKQLISDDIYVLPQAKVVSVDSTPSIRGNDAIPLTKEELGRCTWTVLHMIASQYPENPTRQQKRDAKELMGIISRLYPCKECADHFKEILRANPVQAASREEFSQWLCHVHNIVNRSLGKPRFPCERVNTKWAKLDCGDRGCEVDGSQLSLSKPEY